MNILFLGLGSIGQRHLRNLISLNKKIKFYAIRKKYSAPLLDNKNKIINGDIKKKYKITYLKKFSEIKKKNIKLDAAFICTPSIFHISQAIWLIKNNINVFVEKPLGSDDKKVGDLIKALKKNTQVKAMMGFQLKFNPIINRVKRLISKNFIGIIYSVLIEHGEHINDFHPYEDYKKTYAARKELGGGVILSQIHELDYMYYIFDNYNIKNLNSISGRISKLKINVEDTLISNFLIKKNKKNKFLCTLHLNYYEKPKKRKITILASEGKIVADLNKQNLLIYRKNYFKNIKFKFSRNEIFKKQVLYFLNAVKNKRKIKKSYDLFNGIKSLKLAIKLKKLSTKI